MKTSTKVSNRSRIGLKTKSGVKSGALPESSMNHNRSAVKVKTGVKAGTASTTPTVETPITVNPGIRYGWENHNRSAVKVKSSIVVPQRL